ncbi:syntaxin-11-like isoform X2 [Engraulis encrasicolus]|uniref:syntaxin-11-like isoform X2 n=1 Tax=Engraulis encrasicolus TaxID=184585 RepID=UPI002FD37C91
MRDRMEELEAVAEEVSMGSSGGEWERERGGGGKWESDKCGSEEDYYDDDEEEEDDEEEKERRQEAVVFEEDDSPMQEALREAQDMRREIALLRMEVERLRSQASRCKRTVRRLSFMRGSNAIGLSVKQRAEALMRRLASYERMCEELEHQHGAYAAVCRAARGQHLSLGHALADALQDYHNAELQLRQESSARLQRQAEILGRTLTQDQVEEMVEEGGWGAFKQDLHPEGMTARCAFKQVQERHKELVELESRLRDIHELFLTLATMVEQQGAVLNSVELNVMATHDYVDKTNEKFKTAIRYRKKNPCAQMFCSCFPCWKQATG